MKQFFSIVLLFAILSLTSCSKAVLPESGAKVAGSAQTSAAGSDALPNNGMCVTLRMDDGTQQLVYMRVHPTVQLLPQQMVVSTPLTSITYERNDVVRHQPGKALMAGTSTKSLPAAVTAVGNTNEQILFFGLPKGSHLSIMTDAGLQWRDQDIESDTYALVLTELPRGKYLVIMNAITFRVELR